MYSVTSVVQFFVPPKLPSLPADNSDMELSAPVFDQLLHSLAMSPRAPLGEQRRHDRTPVAAAASILPLSDEFGDVTRVRVSDVSADGIAVLHSKPMTVGGMFLLTIPECGMAPRVQVRCVVRSCAAAADGLYRIGAEFDAVDSAACLLPLAARGGLD